MKKRFLSSLRKTKRLLLAVLFAFSLVFPYGFAAHAASSDLAAGGGKSLFVTRDGILWGMGEGIWPDGYGLYALPTQIMGGVSAVATGASHTLIVRTDGTLLGWGQSDEGQLGRRPPARDRHRHYPLRTMMEDVRFAAVLHNSSYALRYDGTLWVWGDNFRGPPGEEAERHQPALVLRNVKDFAVEASHGLAVLYDGRLMAWGKNVCGQLGSGAEGNRRTPVPVLNDPFRGVPVTAVAVGPGRSMAVTADGALWEWGLLDLGWTVDANAFCPPSVRTGIPQKVTGMTDVIDVAIAGRTTLALKTDGTLWSWGRDVYGLAGTGAIEREEPVQILDQVEALVAPGAYATHVLARRQDGSVWGWGDNTYGQLELKAPGITFDRRRAPVRLPDPPQPIRLRMPPAEPSSEWNEAPFVFYE